MEKNPIIIMAAMEEEFNYLIKKIKIQNKVEIGKYIFFEGNINDYPIVISKCQIGMINAAVTTYIAIQKYHPNVIISQGTAGAHSKNVHTGDIIIGEKCININSIKTPHKKAGDGSNSLEWELKIFNQNEFILQAENNLVSQALKIQNLYGNVHRGTIGSGDVWNNEIDKIIYLNKKYNTICEDMESISIYTVSIDFHIPVIGIRVISNNEILGEKYNKKTGEIGQKFVYNYVKKIIEDSKI